MATDATEASLPADAQSTEPPTEALGPEPRAPAGLQHDLPTEPPPAPRPLTRRVRRRAWTEPHVRSWWLLTAAMFVISAYVTGTEFLSWRGEARLVRGGRVVEAEVMRAGGLSSRWQRLPPDTVVTIRYEVDGKTYTKDGYLRGRTEYIQVRGKVPVRVDPAHPDTWTARAEPPVLVQQLTGAMVVLPVLAVLGVVSVLARARVLRTWRDGAAAAALVVESRQTALAPRSRLVRCTPADRGDNRVVGVYLPQHAAHDLRPGDALWLILPRSGRWRPVAAAWFEDGGSPAAGGVG